MQRDGFWHKVDHRIMQFLAGESFMSRLERLLMRWARPRTLPPRGPRHAESGLATNKRVTWTFPSEAVQQPDESARPSAVTDGRECLG
jgi:hypothetical protein